MSVPRRSCDECRPVGRSTPIVVRSHSHHVHVRRPDLCRTCSRQRSKLADTASPRASSYSCRYMMCIILSPTWPGSLEAKSTVPSPPRPDKTTKFGVLPPPRSGQSREPTNSKPSPASKPNERGVKGAEILRVHIDGLALVARLKSNAEEENIGMNGGRGAQPHSA